MENNCATSDVKCTESNNCSPPCAGLTSNALPEAQNKANVKSLQIGVSTKMHFTERFPILTRKTMPHIGMPSARHMVEKRKHTITLLVNNIVASTEDIQRFKEGQKVRIIDGKFKGVIGNVARYQSQQRVGIVIDGLLTVCMAYIPSAFIVSIE